MTASAVTSAAALPDARVVLITGAAPIPAGPAGPAGIGAALARAFARRGWDVALAVDAEAARPGAEALAAEIAALGRRAAVLVADLASEAGAAALVPACCDALGRPGCIVCHGDPAPADDALNAGHASLTAAFARLVAAPVVLGRALAAATPEAAREDERLRAVLIHVLDDALYHPAPQRLSQALAQAALHRATAAQALALAPKVRVAGLVRGRAPHADELAEAACYLAEAPGVTGATLAVDGGEHLAPPAGDGRAEAALAGRP
ncbi:SDR family NAD(P)-dependent oxidoreductase [Burkholderia glumae]|uniref:SDR family NAD(P)-dependent oxidoreductase n=1 Tax=Burkholderia glumae TaxID=337 RepID=A0AAP9Y1T6_BURGL|nr:SDR family NAD(P)-dependent oxidoreductase [Burkholderia glumae]ACR30338.1 short-chain dehydrogenase [Burkholderia glumae BGR1]AJY65299.1 short chain dehydrogenase family protein [Burkholderia glumae LMG 2196 = ATCC 33617]KHJ60151.1 short-chain dehydrogenase [Burkholderia glumae]MCM2482012.1 SDR family NAD(P)-dependent oxidoreductase [Burkholderia glumae]MCM2507845.1 SDR family NAD(P)-dependent oxidoreductase [Burkholderia glumae]